jgi:PAS domain S-box-containing protein
MDVVVAESRNVRRTTRDLLALSVLPAVWVDYEAPRLANCLVEILFNSVDLDLVLLRMHDPVGALPIEIVRATGKAVSDEVRKRIVDALSSRPGGAAPAGMRQVPDPLGPGTLRILEVPVGVEGDGGVLIVGSQDPLFPTDEDHLLLNVIVNHAAFVLQRRRADEAKRQANAQVHLAVGGSNIGIWEIEMPDGVLCNGRVDFTNVWEQLGYPRPASPTDFATPMSLVHFDDAERLERAINAYLTGHVAKLEVEHRARCSDGSYRWMLTRGVAVRDLQGRPIRLIGSSVDITRHKQAEKALRESEERFRRYFELGLIGMTITSPSKGCLEVNDETCRILGYNREELLSKTWAEMTHPDDLAADVAQFEKVMAGEIDAYTMDKRWVRKDGRVIDTTISVTCVRRDDGSVDYFVALLQDITERKHADAALHVARERLDIAIHSSNIAIWEVELRDGVYTDGLFTQINFWEQLGYDRGEFPTDIVTSMSRMHPDDLERTLSVVEAYLSGEAKEFEIENRVMHKEGSYRWMLSRGAAMRDATGKAVRFVGATMDVTDRKHAQEAVERAREAAERANQFKDEFLATVSHELRTPLAAILLWSQILEDGMLAPGDEGQALRAIRESAQAQQQLIEDLLDVSRMLAGEMRLNVQVIDLTALVQAAVDIVRPIAEAKRIEIHETLDRRAGQVRADASRIQQIVLNLLNNAVKFTPEGGQVRIRLRRANGAVEIQVADTGQGIDAEFLPQVFERFRQADVGMTRRHGGLGLGLAIARQLVELHSGKIRAESQGKGQGATLTVELPIANMQEVPVVTRLPAREDARFGPSPILRGIRALVVEDDVTTREVIRYLLEQCEAEVTVLASAADALREFAASLEGKRFDVLVSDVGMPEMSGYDLMRGIRELERRAGLKSSAPAVALTAYVRDQDRAAALGAGFNTHLSKPVVAATLIKTVAQCVGRTIETPSDV